MWLAWNPKGVASRKGGTGSGKERKNVSGHQLPRKQPSKATPTSPYEWLVFSTIYDDACAVDSYYYLYFYYCILYYDDTY